ncbi:glycosyltransferase, partial [Marinobacter salarius]
MDDRMNVSFVIPCYNEEDVLPITIPKLLKELEKLRNKDVNKTLVYLVDDGSTDRTWDIIDRLSDECEFV